MTKSLTKIQINRLRAATIGYGKMKEFCSNCKASRKSIYKAMSGQPVNLTVMIEIVKHLNHDTK